MVVLMQAMVYNGDHENRRGWANYYMTSHTILRTSKDFYSSMIEARVISVVVRCRL